MFSRPTSLKLSKSVEVLCHILFFSQTRKPFLQHAAISASMASRRPLDSLANVDMVYAMYSWERTLFFRIRGG